MPLILRPGIRILSVAGLLILAGCGASNEPSSALEDANGVVGFVPANSPYVFVAAESAPADVLDKLEASADAMYDSYASVIQASLARATDDVAATGGDADEARGAIEFVAELLQLMKSDNLRAAGIPRGPKIAFYGVDLLPVLRIELANPVAFEAKIAEMESSAGWDMETAEVGGQSYRYFGDSTLQIVVAVVNDHGVLSMVPADSSDGLLRAVLGLDKPARSLADSGTLVQLADTYGFTPYGLGYFDIARVAAQFVEEPTAINAELFAQLGYERSSVPAGCDAELLDLAGIAPRMVSGYTRLDTSRIDSNTVVEIRSDIAAGLQTLAAPVPGLGSDHGGLGSFGMSINLMTARSFVEERIAAYEQAPYKCEPLRDGVQQLVNEMRTALNQPLPPNAFGFRGFLAIVDRIEGLDIAGQRPPEEVDARLLVAVNNAPGLLAMGAMFSPELAALQIEPNGKAVALELPAIAAQVGQAYVALTSDTVALSVGDVEPADLEALLASPPGDPLPTMSMHLDGERYYRFIGEAVRAGNAASAGTEDEVSEDLQEAMTQVMAGFGDLLERISVDIRMTERGIEVPASITLAD